MNDDEIKAMNRRMDMGWEPSRHQWQAVADRCKDIPDMRDLKVWGIRLGRRYERSPGLGQPALVVETYEIVANPQFFHPTSIKASNLTYDEAQALIKLMES